MSEYEALWLWLEHNSLCYVKSLVRAVLYPLGAEEEMIWCRSSLSSDLDGRTQGPHSVLLYGPGRATQVTEGQGGDNHPPSHKSSQQHSPGPSQHQQG